MMTDNFCFYLQNRLIQTSQTGGQKYSDTSPISIPCSSLHLTLLEEYVLIKTSVPNFTDFVQFTKIYGCKIDNLKP